MNKQLLVQYVKMILEADRDARVPNQLLEPQENESEQEESGKAEDVVEFSGTSAVVGVSAPNNTQQKRKLKVQLLNF